MTQIGYYVSSLPHTYVIHMSYAHHIKEVHESAIFNHCARPSSLVNNSLHHMISRKTKPITYSTNQISHVCLHSCSCALCILFLRKFEIREKICGGQQWFNPWPVCTLSLLSQIKSFLEGSYTQKPDTLKSTFSNFGFFGTY